MGQINSGASVASTTGRGDSSHAANNKDTLNTIDFHHPSVQTDPRFSTQGYDNSGTIGLGGAGTVLDNIHEMYEDEGVMSGDRLPKGKGIRGRSKVSKQMPQQACCTPSGCIII
jgi:hypothetical protein